MIHTIQSAPLFHLIRIHPVTWEQNQLWLGEAFPSTFWVDEWFSERGGRCSRPMRTWTLPVEEGSVIVRLERGKDQAYWRWARWKDSDLIEMTEVEAEDHLDPVGAAARAEWRRRKWEEREYAISRGRGENVRLGVHETRPGVYITVVEATARQYRWRRAKPEEIEAYKAYQEAEPACGKVTAFAFDCVVACLAETDDGLSNVG
jgi:hypothetical protein